MWIVTGPAGCGKSTVAEYLAKELEIPFIEGDDVRTYSTLHPQRNSTSRRLACPPYSQSFSHHTVVVIMTSSIQANRAYMVDS